MTTEETPQDQQWLDALAGQTTQGIDPMELAQALAVRAALTKRRAAIEADAAQTDPVRLDAIRQRLVLEGLIPRPGASLANQTLLGRLLGMLGVQGTGGSAAIPLWGVAAIVLVVVVLVVRLGTPQSEQGAPVDVLRGGTARVLIVENPQARLVELEAGLREVKANFTTTLLSDGRIQVDIQASDNALAYLDSLRMDPVVMDGVVRLVIQKTPDAK